MVYKKFDSNTGKIHPLILAIIIIIVGLVFEKWWWQVGLYIVIALFIGAYYRYRT